MKQCLAGVSLLVLMAMLGGLLFWQVSGVQEAGQSPPTPDATVSLLAVGDIMLGRGVQQTADASPERADYPFAQIKSLTASVDIAFANLESPLVTPAHAAHSFTNGYEFPGRISDAAVLGRAGFGIVTLANNHSLDFGAAGLDDTIGALEAAHIQYVGAGHDKAAAEATRYLSMKGLKIAWIAATGAWPGALDTQDTAAAARAPIALFDAPRLLAQIRAARSQADIVIVALHWGEEYQTFAAYWQRAFVEEASQAGADLILGAHPHVLQPFEVVGHTVVAYSLGNFIFDPGWPPESRQSAGLFVSLDKKGVAAAQVIPLQIENNRPRPLLPTERAAALARLAQSSPSGGAFAAQSLFWNGQEWQTVAALAYVRDAANGQQTVLPGSRTIEVQDVMGNSPGYATGRSDAPYQTAPHVPERIQLDQQHSLRVWRPDAQNQWHLIWQSPPDWMVMQFQFADADNDARPELMFTLWKNTGWDDAGIFRNHPFVYGWRNVTESQTHNQYPAIRPVWAGSALAQPFREFALSDFKEGVSSALDGASNQLVVLEGRYDVSRNAPARSLVVFDWNGWGYGADYRSPDGNFSDLNYAPGQPYIFYKSQP